MTHAHPLGLSAQVGRTWFSDGAAAESSLRAACQCSVTRGLRARRSWHGPASVLAVFPMSGGTWSYAAHPGSPCRLSNTNMEPPGRGPRSGRTSTRYPHAISGGTGYTLCSVTQWHLLVLRAQVGRAWVVDGAAPQSLGALPAGGVSPEVSAGAGAGTAAQYSPTTSPGPEEPAPPLGIPRFSLQPSRKLDL